MFCGSNFVSGLEGMQVIDTCLAYSEDQICGEAWWFKEVCGLRRRCRVPRHSFDLGYLTELPIRLGSSLRIVSNAGQLYIYICILSM